MQIIKRSDPKRSRAILSVRAIIEVVPCPTQTLNIGSHRVDITMIYLPYMELVLITTHHAVNFVTDVVIGSICLHGPLLKLRIYLYESAIISVPIILGSLSSAFTETLYIVFLLGLTNISRKGSIFTIGLQLTK